MKELKLTSQNFENEVMKSDKPVLIDFWASWCGPCRMLAPIIGEIAEEHPEIKVGKVNVDEESDLAMAFKVSSIPTVVLMKDGKVVNTSIGFQSKAQIESMFNEK